MKLTRFNDLYGYDDDIPCPRSRWGLHPETRRLLYEADHRWKIKTAMRGLAALFSLLGLSLFAGAIPVWDSTFYWASGPNKGDWEDGFPLGVLLFALLWNLTAIYVLLIRKFAFFPWVFVIVDFLTWAALTPAITWSAGMGLFLEFHFTIEQYLDRHLYDIVHQIGELELGGVILSCFVWVLHFTLFTLACIETHRWRRARRASLPCTRAMDQPELSARVPQKDEEGFYAIELNSPSKPTIREFL